MCSVHTLIAVPRSRILDLCYVIALSLSVLLVSACSKNPDSGGPNGAAGQSAMDGGSGQGSAGIGGSGTGGSGTGGTGGMTAGSSGTDSGGVGATGGSGAQTGGQSGASGQAATGGVGGSSGTGLSDDYFACDATSECELLPRTCCGVCMPTVEDVFAVQRTLVNDADLRMHRGCGSAEQGVDCQAYFAANPCEEQQLSDPFIATCQASRCSALDIREAEFNGCSQDADCTLRIRRGARPGDSFCCPCALPNPGPYDVVAIHKDAEAAFKALVCDDPDQVCAACVPSFPEAASAKCVNDRCEVVVDCGHEPPCL